MATSHQIQCWICNNAPADSSEHRIKKSDLVRSYGRGPYTDQNSPVHFFDDIQTNIRGPKASKLKYKPSLCANCNNNRSQPWDMAYDRFVSWVLENEEAVLKRRLVDFHDVYGSSFPEDQCNLFKYMVKSIGCRFIDAGLEVPSDLVALLPQEHFITALRISFAINEDLLLMPKRSRDTWLSKGEMQAWNCPDSDPKVGYDWHENVAWLRFNYWYGIEPDGNYGNPWIANARFLYFGSFHVFTPDKRAEFAKLVETWRD